MLESVGLTFGFIYCFTVYSPPSNNPVGGSGGNWGLTEDAWPWRVVWNLMGGSVSITQELEAMNLIALTYVMTQADTMKHLDLPRNHNS